MTNPQPLSRTDGSASGEEPTSLDRDEAFHLLQNRRRRAALRYLFEHEHRDWVSMSEVTDAVAAWEYDTTVARLASDQRQRVYIALYQSHLPKLDDADVVDYRRNRGVVVLRPLADVLRPYLADGLDAPAARVLGGRDHAATDGEGVLSTLAAWLRPP